MTIFIFGAQITFDVISIALYLAFVITYDRLFDRWCKEFDENDKRQLQQDTRLAALEKIERGTTEFNKAELDAFMRSLYPPPPDENIQDC